VLSFFRTNSVNAKISGYEPAGKFQEHLVDLEQCQSVEEAIDNADLVLVLTNSDEFAGLESKINNLTTKNCQVIDFWGTLDRELLLERRYASWS
jgi:UDP-glucose 6-dehydrogenase